MPVTLPSSLSTALGPHEQFSVTPSSSASSISHGCAGSSSWLSSAVSVTALAPTRSATRAQSTATLPPPMTTTRLPLTPASPFQLPARRNGSAPTTPSESAPGSGRMRLSCSPAEISTASYSPMR